MSEKNKFRMSWNEDLTRRHWLEFAAKSCLGVAAMQWPLRSLSADTLEPLSPASSNGGTAKSVIYLYMTGGMSHLDTFDPKPGKDVQGPVSSLDSNVSGIRVSQYFPQMAKQMDKVAVMNSLQSTQGAHLQGRYFMHTSYFLRGTIAHPDLGAYTSLLLGRRNPALPANVKIGGNSSGLGAGFLESQHAALPIGDPEQGLQHSQLPDAIAEDQFARRLQRVQQMNASFQKKFTSRPVRAYSGMYDEAVRLMRSKDLQCFDLSEESDATRDAYGDDPFGQGCLLARRLVEKGVRFVEVDLPGWDTHTDNFGRVEELSSSLDRALATLLKDLSERGLLESTLVVLATEFGRTPDIVEDRDNGRNHYPKAFSCLLAGGGVRGGQIYGKTDEEGREVIENGVSVPDFNATIAFALGLSLSQEIISPSRRPFKVAADGQPIVALFG